MNKKFYELLRKKLCLQHDAEILFENVSIIEPSKRKKRHFEERLSLMAVAF
ncbi:MAG: hypothetical protein Q7T83_01720 [Thermodesulfovibrionales bacterium]|nr:hypothetical protein [Thermodesulfovibrionales bacterium]